MNKTKIEWTHHTANLWWGCTEVHAGCFNCYAKSWALRWGFKIWNNDQPRLIVKSVWQLLKKLQKEAERTNEMHQVFVGSMMDIFEKPMNLVDWDGNPVSQTTGELRDQLFQNIDKGMYPNLMFLLLTKRPSNINKYIPDNWKINPPVNVMYGTSPVDQETAEKLINQLIEVNGNKFLSVEPQLTDLTLMPWLEKQQISWVIQGGESGKGRRPFEIQWANKLREECKKTDIPYFFKQIDKVQEIPEELMIRQLPQTVFNCAYEASEAIQTNSNRTVQDYNKLNSAA